MQMTSDSEQGSYNVALCGDFTFNDHTSFRTILNKIADEEINQIRLDLSKVNFIDSAALGMLLLALDESRKWNKELILTGPKDQVKKMFDMAHFNTLFTIK